MISVPFFTPLDDSVSTQADIQAAVGIGTKPATKAKPCCALLDLKGKILGTCTDDPATCGAPALCGDACRGVLVKLLVGGIAIGLVFIAATGLTRHDS